jgi:Right handed beta helix region
VFNHKTTTTLAAAVLAAALAALAVGPTAHAASLPISSCGQTVTTSVFLTQDLDCAGTGIFVGASGITIDLKGHVLKGTGSSIGIDDQGGYDQVTIKNGVVRNFDYGVFAFNGADNLTVSGIVASGNKSVGIRVDGVSASITSATAAGNGGSGIIVTGDSASVRSSSAAGNGGEGIWLEGATPTVKSSKALGNAKSGIIFTGGDAAKATSATANGNGQYGIYAVGGLASIASSTASGNGYIGILVSGDAAAIKKNRAEGNGFPGGVSDGVGMGIFAESFTTAPVGTNVVHGNDQLQECYPTSLCPASSTHTAPTLITSCGQTVTTNAVLTQDLTCPATGMYVGASGITIDLNGHVLKGTNHFEWGISDLVGFDDVTIKNGVVRNFNSGLRAENFADGLTVSNVVASGNNVGIYVIGASANIASSTAAGNVQSGIYVDGDSASIKSSVTAGNHGDGITMLGASLSIKSSSAVGNGNDGVYLAGGSASVASTTASANGSVGLYISGDSASIKSTTASGNGVYGIDLHGDLGTLKGNRADGNGFAGGVSDGFGVGIFTDNFTTPPVGTNIARGNDDPAGCFPSSLC